MGLLSAQKPRNAWAAHLAAPLVRQHGKVVLREGGVALVQVQVVGRLDIKLQAHGIVGGRHGQHLQGARCIVCGGAGKRDSCSCRKAQAPESSRRAE